MEKEVKKLKPTPTPPGLPKSQGISQDLQKTIDLTLLLGDLVDDLAQVNFQVGEQIYRMVPIDHSGKILPVKKTILKGENGGLYYVNQKGKRIYLKEYQRKQCRADEVQIAGFDGGVFCKGQRFVPIPPPQVLTPSEARLQKENLQKRVSQSRISSSTTRI